MSAALGIKSESSFRFALGELWNQNFKLIPSGLVWSASLFALMEIPSFAVKIPAIVVLNVVSLYSAAMLNFQRFPVLKRKFIILLAAIDSFFLICIHNVIYYAHAPESTKLVLVSNFCVSFLLLLFVSVPIAVWSNMGSTSPAEIFQIARATRKRVLVFAILSISLGWIVIFPYVFFGLPFAQLLIIGAARKAES